MNPIVSISHQIRKIRIKALHKKLVKEKDPMKIYKLREEIVKLDKADRDYWIRKHK